MNQMRNVEAINTDTLKTYEREIQKFNTNFVKYSGNSPEQALKAKICDYISECYPTYVKTLPLLNVHIAAIKYWHKNTFGVKLETPAHPASYSDELRILSKEELDQIFEHTRTHICGKMIRLIYAGGTRLDEIIKIRVKDVDFENNAIALRGAKDEISHHTIFPEGIKAMLYREANGKKDEDFLFSIRRDKEGNCLQVSKRTLQSFITRTQEELKMPKFTAQTFRANFAIYLLKKGIGLKEIKTLMGYRRMNALLRYKKILADTEIQEQTPTTTTGSET